MWIYIAPSTWLFFFVFVYLWLILEFLISCRHVHGKKVLVVTNTTIAPLYLDKTISALTDGNSNVTVESVILPDGEKYKNMVCISRFLWLKFKIMMFSSK